MPSSILDDVPKMRLATTMAHYFSFLTLGMSLSILGPTLLDLKQHVNCSLTAISFTLSARSAGYVVGSIIMGFLFPKLNYQLASTGFLLVSAVMSLLIPLVTQLNLLTIVSIVNGFCLGSYDTGTYVSIIKIWKVNSGPAMQGLMFFYTTGSLLASLVAEPFLIPDDIKRKEITNDTGYQQLQPQTRLIYPYGIVAVISLINSASHLILWVFWNHEGEEDKLEEDMTVVSADTTEVEERKIGNNRKIAIIVLAAIFMHVFYGLDITFGSYIMTFAVNSDLQLSKSKGAYLLTLYWTATLIMNAFSVFLFKWMGNEMMLVCSLAVTLIGNIILVPFGNTDEICLWIGVAIIGIGLSSIYACLICYVGELFHLTSSMSSSLVVAAMAGEFVFPFIISAFVESYPLTFVWTVLFCSVTISLLFAVIMLLSRTKSDH